MSPLSEELYLRCWLNGGLYADSVPTDWLRGLPVERLLPHLRALVRKFDSERCARQKGEEGYAQQCRMRKTQYHGRPALLPR